MRIEIWKEAGGPWRLKIDGRDTASARPWSEAVADFGRILKERGCDNIAPLFENWSVSRLWYASRRAAPGVPVLAGE